MLSRCPTSAITDHRPPGSPVHEGSPSKNAGVGCPFPSPRETERRSVLAHRQEVERGGGGGGASVRWRQEEVDGFPGRNEETLGVMSIAINLIVS